MGFSYNLADGAVTGVVAAVALLAAALLTGRDLFQWSEWLFIGGAATVLASSLWALTGQSGPPGLLTAWKNAGSLNVTAPEPSGSEPTPGRFRSIWVDRMLSLGNPWLIAGLMMIVGSFVAAFLV